MAGIVFYSKTSQMSYDLLKLMESHNLLNFFVCKCVDTMSDSEITKMGIQFIPTMVIPNKYEQGKGNIIEGKQTFEYISSIINNRRQNIINEAEKSRKLIQVGELKKRINDGLYEYCQSELSGISDDYAYWSDDMTKDMQMLDKAQTKNFVQYKQDQMYQILTIPENSKANKLKPNEQNKLINDLKKMRNIQDDQMKSVMEQEQIKCVINNNNIKF